MSSRQAMIARLVAQLICPIDETRVLLSDSFNSAGDLQVVNVGLEGQIDMLFPHDTPACSPRCGYNPPPQNLLLKDQSINAILGQGATLQLLNFTQGVGNHESQNAKDYLKRFPKPFICEHGDRLSFVERPKPDRSESFVQLARFG